MNNWQNSLQYIGNTKVKSSIQLRNNVNRVYISSIASQLYCEKKIDFDLLSPEIVITAEQRKGTEIHDDIIPSVPIPMDDIITKITSGDDFACILPVYVIYKGIAITGMVDGILFRKGFPKYLFEIKTTKKKIYKVYKGEKFQINLYAFALEQMGFNTSNLNLVLIKVKQNINKSLIIKDIIKYLDNPDVEYSFLRKHPLRLHNYKFTSKTKATTKTMLDKLLLYWTQAREANPSGNYNKCKPCLYKTECKFYPEMRNKELGL